MSTGRGDGKLVQDVLDKLQAEGIKVVPRREFIDRHPDYWNPVATT